MSAYLVSRANALVFGVFIVILLLVGGMTWERLGEQASARAWSAHTYEALGLAKDLGIAMRDAERGQRGFLLSGNDSSLAPYTAAVGRIPALEAALLRLTEDNLAQQARLQRLSPLVQRGIDRLAEGIRVRRAEGLVTAAKLVGSGTGEGMLRDVEAQLDAVIGSERALLVERQATLDNRAAWVRWLVAAGAAVAVMALAVAARMLNTAWARSHAAEAAQRSLALRLRASLDSLSQGVAVFTPERTLSNWNDCFQVLLELPRAMVRTGAAYAAFAEHGAETGLTLESEAQLRHGTRPAGEATVYELSRADGHVLEVRRTAMPDGGFVLTVSDMTKRAQAEAVLREAQKMQAIGQLTGGIAHDFNNLLTVMLGNLEYVRNKLPADSPLQTRVERGMWAAGRGALLTGQLLAFARKQPLAPVPIDLAATMPDLVPLLRRTLGETIEVRYVESAGLWPAMADAAQLESAVLNLALNARDAMPGGGRLTIEIANKVLDEEYARSHAEVTAGDYTMVAVSDTGHGMTPEVAARVFEPFFTTKPDGRGTGLGLAMVFGFVKQSNGHVKIYSEPGEGTTVRVYLPRAVGAAPAVRQIGAPVQLPRGTATILVVEDDAAVREIAVATLAELGYRVLEAADGDQGLLVFGQHAATIDLLLTDVVLPGAVRGRDLAERIVAIRPEVRVLYMSGYTENSIVHHGRLDDGVQLLGKPFKREELARKVAVALGDADAGEVAGVGDGAAGTNVVPIKSGRGE